MSVRNFALYTMLLLLAACASMGTPDGGPYDETPPVLLTSTPRVNALNVKDNKIVLEFDEFIKLQNAYEKIVVSPPQLQQPEIKVNGKRIIAELFDTLKPSTTYTIDFNDAIVDNNEGNPLESFSFVFSTGDKVDTLGLSGTVLDASNLEPVKGILVGLHSDHSDSAFTKKPFDRISRTDSRGQFSMRGVAPGKYRIYALADANGNYRFDQKSEKIAYFDSLIVPYATPAWRNDTVWHDSITIDTIKRVAYTRLCPDDIVLRAFNEPLNQQYLAKNSREKHNIFKLYFAAPIDTLPLVKGLDFESADAFVVEANATNDTLTYWLKDTLVYYRDTLTVEVTYPAPDSMGIYAPRSDTLRLVPRKSRAKILEEEKKAFEENEKKFLKEAARNDDFDKENPPKYIPPIPALNIESNGSMSMDVHRDFKLKFVEPIGSIDTASIHLYQVVDTVNQPIPYVFRQSPDNIREYIIYAEWRPEKEYKLEIDSAAFVGLYGSASNRFDQPLKFRSLDEYATLRLNIPGTGNKAVVELLNNSDKPVATQRTENNRCTFFFVTPGNYYMRLFIDENGNGEWDTGNYENKQQAEKVYYYPRMLDLRAMFEYDQNDWNINMPAAKQKPLEITKQKPDKVREKRNRNAERKFK
ncbi:MAG: Ig-like domain-containing protein [Bacteroidaceae bacterium]|nr:Ig-like domain-containing protein [Bacteroidaceae bacterium]